MSKTPVPDIAALIRASRGHDAAALDQLLGLYRNYLRLVARNSLSGPLCGKADPSDLVQETLLEAIQGFDRFQGDNEETFVAWLRQILARNVSDFARRYRTAGRDLAREVPIDDAQLAARLHRLGQSVRSPSQSAQRRELGVLLADALAELTAEQREVIVLRNLQSRPWAEIAAEMGRSEEAARKLWTRALINLKPLLENRL